MAELEVLKWLAAALASQQEARNRVSKCMGADWKASLTPLFSEPGSVQCYFDIYEPFNPSRPAASIECNIWTDGQNEGFRFECGHSWHEGPQCLIEFDDPVSWPKAARYCSLYFEEAASLMSMHGESAMERVEDSQVLSGFRLEKLLNTHATNFLRRMQVDQSDGDSECSPREAFEVVRELSRLSTSSLPKHRRIDPALSIESRTFTADHAGICVEIASVYRFLNSTDAMAIDAKVVGPHPSTVANLQVQGAEIRKERVEGTKFAETLARTSLKLESLIESQNPASM